MMSKQLTRSLAYLTKQAQAKGSPAITQVAWAHHDHASHDLNREKIGNREVVGFGFNGIPNYVDRVDFPMPAIRFKENTPDIQALREKEKGDWRKLTIEEKKALYRASFCQTFAELNAPTGEWKSIVGLGLMALSAAVWMFIWMKKFVYDDLPPTMAPERQEAQLKRMLDIQINPVEGLSSKWDYEKGKWKE